MTNLTTDAEVSYGDYTFSVYSKTMGIECRPVWDAAGRTITHTIYRFTIKDIVQSSEGTDADLESIQQELMQPAAPFVYDSIGFGGVFHFNSTKRDLVWGPKPGNISFTHHGSGNCWEFTWSVEVATMVEPQAKDRDAIMEWNYRVSWSTDQAGYTTRRINGVLKIPQTRSTPNDRAIKDSADAYLDKITPPQVPGFRRQPIERTLDDAKCTLTFAVTDEEMPPNMPPEGVVHASASHRVESSPNSLLKWTGTLSAKYEMGKGLTPRSSGVYFAKLVADRIGATKAALEKGGKGKAKLGIIPLKISINEPDIYGRGIAEFSFTYTFCCKPGELLKASGLWRPVPGSNWQAWSKSLGRVLQPRGVANMGFVKTDDAIVDLGGGTPRVVGGTAAALKNFTHKSEAELADMLTPKEIDPGKSWLNYEAQVRIVTMDEVAELKPLPRKAPQQRPSSDDVVLNTDGYKVPSDASVTVIQERAGPTVEVVFTGQALRANYEIDPPQLSSVGGKKPILNNGPDNGFWTGVVANYGVPIVGAMWSFRYIMPGVPTGGNRSPLSPALAPPSGGGGPPADSTNRTNWDSEHLRNLRNISPESPIIRIFGGGLGFAGFVNS